MYANRVLVKALVDCSVGHALNSVAWHQDYMSLGQLPTTILTIRTIMSVIKECCEYAVGQPRTRDCSAGQQHLAADIRACLQVCVDNVIRVAVYISTSPARL